MHPPATLLEYAGLALIILGVGFVITEGFAPTFGILGIGGTLAFTLGSIMLINTDYALYRIAWPIIGLLALINIMMFITLISTVLKSRRQTIKNGLSILVGATGRALGPINLEGQAVIRGEIWNVHAKSAISADKQIKVLRASGLLLEVTEDTHDQ